MAAMEDSAGVMPVSKSASVCVSAFCCGWIEEERGREEENWREGEEEMWRMVRWEALKVVGLKEVMMGRAGRERRRRSAERQDEQIMVGLDR